MRDVMLEFKTQKECIPPHSLTRAAVKYEQNDLQKRDQGGTRTPDVPTKTVI